MTSEDERWVNAVITITVPMANVDTASSLDAKMAEVVRLHEDLAESLPDSFAECVSESHWEDVSANE